jgi:hypothetical protein
MITHNTYCKNGLKHNYIPKAIMFLTEEEYKRFVKKYIIASNRNIKNGLVKTYKEK